MMILTHRSDGSGKRAGINQEVVDRLMQTFRIQTRNGGRALADSAVMEGRMDTPAFRFHAPSVAEGNGTVIHTAVRSVL